MKLVCDPQTKDGVREIMSKVFSLANQKFEDKIPTKGFTFAHDDSICDLRQELYNDMIAYTDRKDDDTRAELETLIDLINLSWMLYYRLDRGW